MREQSILKCLSLSETNDAAKDIPRGLGQKILIVDDVEEQREIASSMLTYLGHKVQVTGSRETALEALKEQTFDLGILDDLPLGFCAS